MALSDGKHHRHQHFHDSYPRGDCHGPEDREFLNLWFAKPMVCVRVAFHENDRNHENDENDDNSDSYKQGVECWIRGNHGGNRENDENHGNPGCKSQVPQTTGLEIPEKRQAFSTVKRRKYQTLKLLNLSPRLVGLLSCACRPSQTSKQDGNQSDIWMLGIGKGHLH